MSVPRCSMRSVRFSVLALLLPLLTPCLARAADELPGWMAKPFGYAQFWYSNDNTPGLAAPTEMKVQRVRLGGMGAAAPNLTYILLGEWADLSPNGKGKPGLVDANATYKFSDLANLRLGQDWYRFGMEANWTLFEMPFIMRAEAVDGIWLTMGRNGSYGYDRGVFAFGKGEALSLPFKYNLSVTGGAGLNASDDNGRQDLTARLVVSPLKGLDVGASVFTGASRISSGTWTGDLLESAYAAEAYYSLSPKARFFGEYLSAFQAGSSAGNVSRVKPSGYYLAAGYSPLPRTEVLARYAYYDKNSNVPNSGITTWTLGATYALSGHTNLKLDYLIRSPESRYATVRPGNLALLQLQVFFFPEQAAKNFLQPLGL